ETDGLPGEALGVARSRGLDEVEGDAPNGECAADLAAHSPGLLLPGGGVVDDERPPGVRVERERAQRANLARSAWPAIRRRAATRSSVGGWVLNIRAI